MRNDSQLAEYSVKFIQLDAAMKAVNRAIQNSDGQGEDLMSETNDTPKFGQLMMFSWVLPMQLLALGLLAPGDGGRWFGVAACLVSFFDLAIMLMTPRTKQLPLFVAAAVAAAALSVPGVGILKPALN